MIVFVVVVVIRCSNPDVFACKVELLPSKGIVARPYSKLVCVHLCVLWFRRICWCSCCLWVEGMVGYVSVCWLCSVADMSQRMVVCWMLQADALFEMV